MPHEAEPQALHPNGTRASECMGIGCDHPPTSNTGPLPASLIIDGPLPFHQWVVLDWWAGEALSSPFPYAPSPSLPPYMLEGLIGRGEWLWAATNLASRSDSKTHHAPAIPRISPQTGPPALLDGGAW